MIWNHLQFCRGWQSGGMTQEEGWRESRARDVGPLRKGDGEEISHDIRPSAFLWTSKKIRFVTRVAPPFQHDSSSLFDFGSQRINPLFMTAQSCLRARERSHRSICSRYLRTSRLFPADVYLISILLREKGKKPTRCLNGIYPFPHMQIRL